MSAVAPLRRLRRSLDRFRRDTRGSLSVETLFALIMMGVIWLPAALSFYYVYSMKEVNERAGYTISDIVTRREDPVSKAYIDNLNRLVDFLMHERGETSMRVTGIDVIPAAVEGEDPTFTIVWSYGTRGRPMYTSAQVEELKKIVPFPKESRMIVLTETYIDSIPAWVGLDSFSAVIPMMPRFTPQILCSDCDPQT